MRKLSLTILALITCLSLSAMPPSDSPHGKDFKLNCDLCHSAKSWKLDRTIYAYDHNKSAFPLEGQHQSVECRQCHLTLVFSEAKTSCIDCHTDIHYQTVGPDCGRCHTPRSWIIENITELHQRSRFPLVGAHYTTDCSLCHKDASLLRFEPLGVNCIDCHEADYLATTNPNHVQGGYSTNCIECHSLTDMTWTSKAINHDFFPLTLGHAISDCSACHKNGGFTNLSKECVSCHLPNYNATTNPNHAAASIPTACSDCHTTEPGWKPATFAIHDTYYPLTGAHATMASCNQCHNGNYATTPNTCVGCHQANYNATTNPNHVADNIPVTCSDCHTINPGWKPAIFPTHDNYFALIGAHATINCEQCHNGNYTNNLPNTCVGCHLANYNNTTNPPHASTGFGTDCQTCHSQTAWTPATFNHDGQFFPIYSGKHQGTWNLCTDCHTNSSNYQIFSCIDCHDHNQADMDSKHSDVGGYTYNSIACYECHPTGSVEGAFNHNNSGFPLTGAHLTTPCTDCHITGWSGTPTDCAACHITAYNQSNNPNHLSLGLPTACGTCHTTNPGWTPATFGIHGNYYPLTGAHTTTNCNQCHNGNYTNIPNTCVGCHQANYNTTTNPPHGAIGISTDCQSCHTTNPGWAPATFTIHNNYYPLTGAHTSITCNQCHNGNYTNIPNTCVGCHQANYNNTTNPPHGAIGISTDCQSCHTTNPGWTPATFTIHNNYYPLTGAHATMPSCNDCHNGNYTNPPNTCVGCHQANYNNTTNPPHGAIGISTDCQSCHTTNPGWTPATFTIHNNYYPLTGAHTTITCNDCHNGNYTNIPNTCVGCHQANYNNTTNPPHGAIGISTDCQSCHTTNPGWTPATFTIHNNYYPLTGAHTTITCNQCHNGNYTNIPNTCVGCHQTDYNNTTNPPHGAIGISTDCQSCHTTNPGWAPATFTIHNNYYPLTGAHTTITCNQCHNGNYTNIPNTCVGCHQTNYNQTTNPPHLSQGFPTNCDMCHTTTAWSPSTFNHTPYFPIYSGHHEGVWSTCAACHPTPGNFLDFTCTTSCHPQNQTNNEHDGVSGYSYNSTACYNCHPTGGGGGKMIKPQQRFRQQN